MKILVTGGAGFIASHIAEAYRSAGHDVEIADDLSTGKKENLPAGIPFHEMDIADGAAVEKLMQSGKFEVISHHAAQLDVRKSVADPVFDARVNILGSLNLIEHGLKNGLKKVIFASSGGTVYGEQSEFPATENHPTHPISPYGVAKLTVEHYLYYFAAVQGLNYVALRYANIYGPRQNPHGEAGVIAIFANKILDNQQPLINGDGKQTRDYVFVDDVVRANLLALDYNKNTAFNIGTGVETDVVRLFDLINENLGGKFERKFAPAKDGEQRRSVLSYSTIERELGWKPKYNLEDGIRVTMEWFRNRKVTA